MNIKLFAPLVLLQLLGAGQACSTVQNSQITFYGWPDNDPPGPGTAYDCGGRNYVAGGTGTYSDPLTFASAPGEYEVCEIVYVPYLKKYARMEDYCAQCTTDWQSGRAHVDFWTGSNTSGGGDNQIQCENELTREGAFNNIVVRQPANNYAVDTGALYANGNCGLGHTYPSPQNPCA